MPPELWVTNTNFGGRPGRREICTQGYSPSKNLRKKGKMRGGRGPRGGERQGVQYLAVLHLKSKGEGVSCPSNDIQDTAAYS